MDAVAKDQIVVPRPRLFGLRVTPLTQRRWRNFKANRRGYVSLWIFLILFGLVTVLGFMKLGPLTLRREFCVPELCSLVPEPEGGANLMTT